MKRAIFLSGLLICLVLQAAAQQMPKMPAIPADPEIRVGTLPNGMTYYIRHNEKPEKQAEFYILHNVGAIQEDTTQIGLAHFLEHMAFNGTKNFPGKDLINYLEKIGVKFGANLNAGTGQETTVYNMSNVPLLREGIVDSCLLILHDWSYFISLLPEQIDKERGVIVEELRTGNTAGFRTREEIAPTLYNHSRYAYRNIIGNEAGLRNFGYQQLTDFYHKWYRTDLQALIVVGDFDVNQMEAKIRSTMADIPAVQNPAPKVMFPVPDNAAPLVAVATDPEMMNTTVALYIKREPIPRELNDKAPIAQVKTMLRLIAGMASERLSELALLPDAPFITAGFGSGSLTQTCDALFMRANAREGQAAGAFEALCTELEKIRRFGFTETELDRARIDMMRSARQQYDGRNDRRNSYFVNLCLGNYIKNAPMPPADIDWEMDSLILAGADLLLINQMASQLITDQNRVITVTGPEKAGVATPSQQDLLAIMERVGKSDVAQYTDDTVIEPLVQAPLKGAAVAKTAPGQFGSTVWTLANGVRVVIKPTDFKADELLMRASSRGGLSVLSDADYPSGDMLTTLVGMSGVGKFSAIQLSKQLTGKAAEVSPYVSQYSNGLSGKGSPKDLETMLQLTYLYFTQPRFDRTDYDVMIDKYVSALANAGQNPGYVMQKRTLETLYGNNIRRQSISTERLGLVHFEDMQRIWKSLYSNAADFTFTFVGNLDPAQAKPLIEKYLGSLPVTKQKLTWRDDKVREVAGKVEDTFAVPMKAPKSTVMTVFSGPMPYTLETALTCSFLQQILSIRYTESIREEKGGTYGVRVGMSQERIPAMRYTLMTTFDTDPAMATELQEIIVGQIALVASEGPKAEDVEKVREYMVKQRQDNLKINNLWLSYLNTFYTDGLDMNTDYDRTLASIDAAKIKALAAKVLADGNMTRIVMNPE